MYEDHTNILFNHEDLCRAFDNIEGIDSSAEDLLQTLTLKFNKMLEALKQEETEKKKYQRKVIELETQIKSYEGFKTIIGQTELQRENENLKNKCRSLEGELKIANYEK